MGKQNGKRRSKKPSKVRAERTQRQRSMKRSRELALRREEEQRENAKMPSLKSMLPQLRLPELNVKSEMPTMRLPVPQGMKKPKVSDLEMQK